MLDDRVKGTGELPVSRGATLAETLHMTRLIFEYVQATLQGHECNRMTCCLMKSKEDEQTADRDEASSICTGMLA